MVKVLDDAFGVEKGLMTTVHAYTGDQMLVDGPHNDLRRARAAAINIIPTSTGAARATGLVLESMKGKLDGTSLRVPVPDGSITDFTAILKTDGDRRRDQRRVPRRPPSGPAARVLEYTEEPIVSSDIVGSPAHRAPSTPGSRWPWATWSRCSAGTTTSGATPTAWSTSSLTAARSKRRRAKREQ